MFEAVPTKRYEGFNGYLVVMVMVVAVVMVMVVMVVVVVVGVAVTAVWFRKLPPPQGRVSGSKVVPHSSTIAETDITPWVSSSLCCE